MTPTEPVNSSCRVIDAIDFTTGPAGCLPIGRPARERGRLVIRQIPSAGPRNSAKPSFRTVLCSTAESVWRGNRKS